MSEEISPLDQLTAAKNMVDFSKAWGEYLKSVTPAEGKLMGVNQVANAQVLGWMTGNEPLFATNDANEILKSAEEFTKGLEQNGRGPIVEAVKAKMDIFKKMASRFKPKEGQVEVK